MPALSDPGKHMERVWRKSWIVNADYAAVSQILKCRKQKYYLKDRRDTCSVTLCLLPRNNPLAPNASFAVHRFCIPRWGFNLVQTNAHGRARTSSREWQLQTGFVLLYPGVLPSTLVCRFIMMVQGISSILLCSHNESWEVTLDLKDPVSWALCRVPWILCNFCHNNLMRKTIENNILSASGPMLQ